MNKLVVGTVLIIIALIGLLAVYNMRPPAGLSDAFTMMAEGREVYLRREPYLILMGFFGVLGIISVPLAAVGWVEWKAEKDKDRS